MTTSVPGLLLIAMICLTLILLPRIHDERGAVDEPRRSPDELHIKTKRKP